MRNQYPYTMHQKLDLSILLKGVKVAHHGTRAWYKEIKHKGAGHVLGINRIRSFLTSSFES